MASRLILVGLFALGAAVVLPGCAPVVYGSGGPPPPPPPAYYYPPPPPPIYEPVPPPPFYGAVWVGGHYYHWHGGWRWHHGYYRHY